MYTDQQPLNSLLLMVINRALKYSLWELTRSLLILPKAAIAHAKNNDFNTVILDTAGRLHVDEDMMNELIEIKANVSVDQTILEVDSMTGQDAVNVASSFNEKVGIDGVILTKLDGDTRGGALHFQLRQLPESRFFMLVWGKNFQILNSFIQTVWHQEYLVWGMSFTLIEKAEAQLDADKAKAMEEKA